jgi:hypothetical protein
MNIAARSRWPTVAEALLIIEDDDLIFPLVQDEIRDPAGVIFPDGVEVGSDVLARLFIQPAICSNSAYNLDLCSSS